MKNLIIRKATHEDYEGVKRLCFSDNPKDFVPEIWPVWMAGTNTINLVAVAGDQIIGCFYGEILTGQDGWAQGFRVRSDFRRSGIGTKLGVVLENELFQLGGKNIYANIAAFNVPSLSASFKSKWEVDTHFMRRQIKSTGGRQSRKRPVLFSRDNILKLIHNNPVLASRKKVAHFQRAYFSITNGYIDQAIQKKAIRISPDGLAYAITDFETDPAKKLWIVAINGEKGGIKWLLESFIEDAGYGGAELVVDSTNNAWLQSLMDELQFVPPGKDDNYVVVKKDLSGINTHF